MSGILVEKLKTSLLSLPMVLITHSLNFYFLWIQSNLAISNSVISTSPLFRRKIECPWIYPSLLRFPAYFEDPLFRTFFHFLWEFEIAGFDCTYFSWLLLLTKLNYEISKPWPEMFDVTSESGNQHAHFSWNSNPLVLKISDQWPRLGGYNTQNLPNHHD